LINATGKLVTFQQLIKIKVRIVGQKEENSTAQKLIVNLIVLIFDVLSFALSLFSIVVRTHF